MQAYKNRRIWRNSNYSPSVTTFRAFV